jgi:hypothetical protein
MAKNTRAKRFGTNKRDGFHFPNTSKQKHMGLSDTVSSEFGEPRERTETQWTGAP